VVGFTVGLNGSPFEWFEIRGIPLRQFDGADTRLFLD
jgi:hypothetical protein